MRKQLVYEVVADGGTDRMLVPIIEWAIHRLDPQVEILEPQFMKRSGSVAHHLDGSDRTGAMLSFVHRDAESESYEVRLQEFDGLLGEGLVPVIPVRMTEAWIAFDGEAIALAADRPSAIVNTPRVRDLEGVADPKGLVEQLLLEASGARTGRKRKSFQRSLTQRRVNVASLIEDYSPLEHLGGFQRFQGHLATAYPYPV